VSSQHRRREFFENRLEDNQGELESARGTPKTKSVQETRAGATYIKENQAKSKFAEMKTGATRGVKKGLIHSEELNNTVDERIVFQVGTQKGTVDSMREMKKGKPVMPRMQSTRSRQFPKKKTTKENEVAN